MSLFSTTPRTFMGMKLITSPFIPNEVPRIQVREITLKDGTPLLSRDFLARENKWWLDQFGTKEVAFILDGQQAIAIGSRLKQALERQIESAIWGGASQRR